MPGSVTQGRWTRAFPSRYCFLIPATARRDDRSDPGNPIATSLSWATSARILPFDFSTHSSIFGRNSSTNRGRHDRGRAPPASRSATTRATVWWEHPATSAAACNEPIKSNAASISMDSSADFTVVPPGGSSGASAPSSGTQEGPQPREAAGAGGCVGSGDPRSRWAVSWPPVGRNRGHQRAVSWPPTGSFSWPPTSEEVSQKNVDGSQFRVVTPVRDHLPQYPTVIYRVNVGEGSRSGAKLVRLWARGGGPAERRRPREEIGTPLIWYRLWSTSRRR